jgi:hypothetical protein
MKKQIAKLMVAVGFAGAVVAGTITSCDDNNNNSSTGTAGTGGTTTTGFAGYGGTTGTGGTSTGGTTAAGGGGGTNVAIYTMTMSGSQETPANSSTATGNVVVTLNRSNGSVSVVGTFSGLSSNATAAHIHGPADVGVSAPVIVPLQVPSATSGAVTGTATMNATNMDDMLNGKTYLNIHSVNYPDGEIRAQIK